MGIFLPKNMGGNMGISDPVGGRTRSADSKKYGHIPGQKYAHIDTEHEYVLSTQRQAKGPELRNI